METQTFFAPALEARYLNPNLWGKIMSLDFTLIRDRMIIKYTWSEQRTDDAIEQYRQYLYMTQVLGTPIAPTSDVDEIWHQHILHTNKYAIDCKKVFGKFLHHLPTPSKWKQAQMQKENCQSPCCNHQDCCNDNPSRTAVTVTGSLVHTDCGNPEGGEVNIGGDDVHCSGTTNDGFKNSLMNFDNPDMSNVSVPVLFKDVVSQFFKN